MVISERHQIPLPAHRRKQITRSKRKKPKTKRVAAYIGSDVDDKTNKALRLYFTSKITANPFWKFTGIYDESESQTSEQEGLAQLLSDCTLHNIDSVLVKDLTHLSSVASELILIINQFTDLNVSLHFDKEGIQLPSSGGRFLLSVLANVASDWNDHLDEDFSSAIQDLFFEGQYKHTPLYGYHWKVDHFEVCPEEADAIVRMYTLYAEGNTLQVISQNLADNRIFNRNKKPFSGPYIYSVFTQEKYHGFTFVNRNSNYPSRSAIADNASDLPFVLKGTHPKLISEKLHQQFLSEQKRRQATGLIQWSSYSCFTRRIRCGNCNEIYVLESSAKNTFTPFFQGSYRCKTRLTTKGANCSNSHIPVYTLKKVCAQLLAPLFGEDPNSLFKEAWVEKLVAKIVIFDDRIELHLKNEQVLSHRWKNTATKDYWILFRKLRDQHFKGPSSNTNSEESNG